MAIHPMAIVDKGAEIDPTVEVGAYAVIEGGVQIGAETRIYPHAYISQGTTLGRRCQIHPFAIVGHLPQDLKYDGSPTFTQVGDETVVREHASIHRGAIPGSTTIVGRRCFLMATSHIAHNCIVGDDVKIANEALLAGHVEMGDGVFLSAHAMVHQFTRVGKLVMGRGAALITNDVPPFMLVGPRGVMGLNIVGLRRAGLTGAERLELRECHRLLYRSTLTFPEAIERVAQFVQSDPGRQLVEFLQAPTKRGYLRLRKRADTDGDTDTEDDLA
jgi:UDP-N-acetylglucosamine acyltransferase